MRAAGLLLTVLLASGTAGAQDYLNCHFVAGWEPSGAKRQYIADNLFEYKDGSAEGYLSFGFVRMQGITCASGANTLDIDVSEMGDADSAYGMFATNLDPSLPVAKIGMGGQVQRQSASFAKGKYYVELVEVAANPDSDDTATMQAFVAKMLGYIEGRETPPAVLEWFAKEDLASTRMIPESVLGLRELKQGYVAKYKLGQAFIVQEASPEAAAAVLKSLRERFEGATSAKVGDEAFQAKVKYLDGICIFRKGKTIAGYANLSGPEDAATQAAKLATRIP
ncbi:MAG TPA: DUF6599 family protein [Terracidiphilus sp.]|nr:DUF6599 family protein [Terracidiphilus sp.]